LNFPINYKNRNIQILELPAPKLQSFYKEGFEHVEFVVTYPLETFLSKYKNVDFDLSGYGKRINRDIRLRMGSNSVKFHEQALVKIIEKERETRKER
jgi:predicted metalloenzyme YecM